MEKIKVTQKQILVETLEKVEKPTYWKDLVQIAPLKDSVNEKGQGDFPTPNSYRSVMSSSTYNKIFKRDKDILVVYSLQENYKQELKTIIDKLEGNK